MNYLKIYIQLVKNAQSRKLLPKNTYTENHHIFPISIFGNNDKIVELTGKEHFIAHLLLLKIYQRRFNKRLSKGEYYRNMLFAFRCMSNKLKLNSRKYNLNIKIKSMGLSEETKEKIRKVNIGKRHSKETKEKMSKVRKGKKQTAEHIEKRFKNIIGRKHSEETKEKMRKAKENISDETREKYSKAAKKRIEKYGQTKGFTGKKHSDAAKEKISNANKGKKRSVETREKLSKASKGRKHSEKTKLKLSEMRKGEKNHNFGTIWINDTKNNKKIKKEDFELYSKEGWIKGRINNNR